MLGSIKDKLYKGYKEAYTAVVSVHKDSKFEEKGILTPNEFVVAGDQLVNMCPTWTWKPAADEKHRNKELPDEKQFLYSRVPCQKRVKDTMEIKTIEKDLGDGWSLADAEDSESDKKKKIEVNLDEDEKVKKIETVLEDEDGIEVKVSKTKKEDEDEKDDFVNVDSNNDETRFYDLTITFDMYYLTPRLWLSGYSSDGSPLNDKDMFEDIVDDYANKTVTYEAHPNLGVNQMSIHPCKHANVMKHLIEVAKENGSKVEVHHAMFVFLKFISSVVPTMEYDFTVDIELA
mmetsp:Transcript_34171/g.30915  ORF Transcript_34171/g.30915 Transcript_34171/m.30915 type:complete len:288 (+) Transcript_34171:65-928(+)